MTQNQTIRNLIAMIGKKEVLYFVSNRKLQSAGGYDIWYTVYDTIVKHTEDLKTVVKKSILMPMI
jgi:hypothetical protein